MITNRILEYIFSAPSNVTVLRVLNERNIGISGRETARLTGLSLRTVQICLSNLEKAGVLKKSAGKREHLYIIDRGNFLSRNLIEHIFELERNFIKEIYTLIKNRLKNNCVSIIHYGSAARGDDNIDSDFDVCFIYLNKLTEIEDKVSDLRSLLFNIFNITLAPLYISEKQFRKLAIHKKPPVDSIIKDGKVITGKKLKELLNG